MRQWKPYFPSTVLEKLSRQVVHARARRGLEPETLDDGETVGYEGKISNVRSSGVRFKFNQAIQAQLYFRIG